MSALWTENTVFVQTGQMSALEVGQAAEGGEGDCGRQLFCHTLKHLSLIDNGVSPAAADDKVLLSRQWLGIVVCDRKTISITFLQRHLQVERRPSSCFESPGSRES